MSPEQILANTVKQAMEAGTGVLVIVELLIVAVLAFLAYLRYIPLARKNQELRAQHIEELQLIRQSLELGKSSEAQREDRHIEAINNLAAEVRTGFRDIYVRVDSLPTKLQREIDDWAAHRPQSAPNFLLRLIGMERP